MNRILTILLITTTLFANVAWAMDTHAEAYFGHGTEWSQDGSIHTNGHDESEACDHCCHGLAHLTGMLQQPIYSADFVDRIYRSFSTQYYLTRNQSPPNPPPNT